MIGETWEEQIARAKSDPRCPFCYQGMCVPCVGTGKEKRIKVTVTDDKFMDIVKIEYPTVTCTICHGTGICKHCDGTGRKDQPTQIPA